MIPFSESHHCTEMSSTKLLIFGGTFDPPHRAHTVLPPLVAQRIECARILYVPATLNPLKMDHPPTPAHHRVAMLRIALASVANAELCTIELERPGPSFTVDTLESLHEQYGPGVQLRLLLGSDQALEFVRWKDWQRILELATPAVLLRPPLDHAQFHAQLRAAHPPDFADRWLDWIVATPQLDISATELRDRLASDEGLDELLDPGVLEYIREQELYAE